VTKNIHAPAAEIECIESECNSKVLLGRFRHRQSLDAHDLPLVESRDSVSRGTSSCHHHANRRVVYYVLLPLLPSTARACPVMPVQRNASRSTPPFPVGVPSTAHARTQDAHHPGCAIAISVNA